MSDQFGSQLVDEMLRGHTDWRGEMLSRLRSIIKEADPDVTEELKWRKPSNPTGVAVWSDDGMICTGEVYKNHVKLTFAKGATLADPDGLFNSSLDGRLRRAIDFHEDDILDEGSIQAMVRSAVKLNKSKHRR